jgi:hypothetical protein
MRLTLLISTVLLLLFLWGCGSHPPLHEAAYVGDIAKVKELLTKGVDPNKHHPTTGFDLPYDIYGMTPLMIAAKKGETQIVRLLLASGADPELRCSYKGNKTAADFARDFPKLQRLLKHAIEREGEKEQWFGEQRQMSIPESIPSDAGTSFPRKPVWVVFKKSPPRPYDIAVIIGNADYASRQKHLPNVVPAYADAEGIRRYVGEALGILDGNTIFVSDATQADLISIFGSRDDHRGKLFNWTQPGLSNVFVYFSGHGAPGDSEGSAYLVPVDADPTTVGLNGYSLTSLYRNLGKIPARSITVVLEACFSGGSPGGSIIPNASAIFVKPKTVEAPTNLTVITAGKADQWASWERDKSHSLFTKYFLKGMSGEADRDEFGDGDGKVGWGEINRYFKRTVTYLARRYYGRDQTPHIAVATD